MTLKEIVDGLQFTLDMFLFDPTTGKTYPEPRNDMDKITIDACKGAIELLEKQPCEDCISREEAVYVASGYCAPQNIADELRKLPSVIPTNVFDKIINKIEQARDKDKIAEYPYNRCIDIVKTVFEEHNE